MLTTFTRQLATLVDAGLPLLRGMRVLEKQERNVTLKGIIGELAVSVEGGSTFSEALAQHPKVFNKLFVNMVKAGELGGVLEVVLNRLAEFMEKAQKIKGKVVSAMFYPRGGVDGGDCDSDDSDGVGDSRSSRRCFRTCWRASVARIHPACAGHFRDAIKNNFI